MKDIVDKWIEYKGVRLRVVISECRHINILTKIGATEIDITNQLLLEDKEMYHEIIEIAEQKFGYIAVCDFVHDGETYTVQCDERPEYYSITGYDVPSLLKKEIELKLWDAMIDQGQMDEHGNLL